MLAAARKKPLFCRSNKSQLKSFGKVINERQNRHFEGEKLWQKISKKGDFKKIDFCSFFAVKNLEII